MDRIRLTTASGLNGGSAKAKGTLFHGDRTTKRLHFFLPEGYVRFGEPVYQVDVDGISAGGRAVWVSKDARDATVESSRGLMA